MGEAGRLGSLGRRAVLAWIFVVLFAGVVLWLGTPNFSASRSYSWLTAFLRFFDPDVTFDSIIWVHHLIRKGMHLFVYAILALLAFRASWLTFGNLLARVSMTAIFVAVGVALIDEARQATLVSRTGSPYDVMIDGMGAVAAVGIAVLAQRYRAGRRAREQT